MRMRMRMRGILMARRYIFRIYTHVRSNYPLNYQAGFYGRCLTRGARERKSITALRVSRAFIDFARLQVMEPLSGFSVYILESARLNR
jgi:hypothetical protein